MKMAIYCIRFSALKAMFISTLVMFPILVVVYVRLANKEEQIVISEFGDEYLSYISITPAWIPKFNFKKSYKKQGENHE